MRRNGVCSINIATRCGRTAPRSHLPDARSLVVRRGSFAVARRASVPSGRGQRPGSSLLSGSSHAHARAHVNLVIDLRTVPCLAFVFVLTLT